ncbi:hypothetical protein A2U01_0036349 [Trifolium medium]|uniref:Uncharacterized protein n=1 Tax=Trifolium medium TaxID=97028 RepID=A0A392PSY9_9FABA|nr:hypothetical protein [Trifolium medium]
MKIPKTELLSCEQNISRTRPDFDDPNGQTEAPGAANLPSKFERYPTVNESGIDDLVGLV